MASIPGLDPIAFACPACGQRFSAPPEFAGRVMPCHTCRVEMTVPDPAADTHATMLIEPDAASTPAPRQPPGRPYGVAPWPTRPPV